MHTDNAACDSTDNTVVRKDTVPASDGSTSVDTGRLPFPVVGVGASAGGLNAFRTLFDSLPDRPGMAFVLIQHLDSQHERELASILQNHTKMPVIQVADHEKIHANCIYVIPPGKSLVIENGTLRSSAPEVPRRRRAPIDLFLQSLADNLGENAICLVLSGTGNDGMLGLRRIKEKGGMVLVQTPDDAEYTGMPKRAIQTGLADQVAPVGELAQQLVEYRQRTEHIQVFDTDEKLAEAQAAVTELGLLALRGTPLDALMDIAVHKVAATLDVDYAKVLQLSPGGDELLLLAGIGWQEGLVGTATVGTGADSQAGYTLRSNEPVIVEDLRTEGRFRGPTLLTDHNVVSGISVVIHGTNGPFGAFGAHTRSLRHFTRQDTDFLQGIANVLAAAVERQQAEAERAELLDRVQAEQVRLETILQQMPAGVIIADAPTGRLVMSNDMVEEIWRQPALDADTIQEYARYTGFHLDGTPLVPDEWPLARALSTGEVVTGEEVLIERGDGTRGIIANSAAPIYDEAANIVAGVVVFQDVTERKELEAERNELVQELQALTATLEKRVEARTQQLRMRSEQLHAVASALTVAEQRERERISQVLHDDLQQLLHAAQMRVRMLASELDRAQANEEVRQNVQELTWLTDQALTITRSLTVELSPPVLADEGIADALAWLAGHMERTYGLRVDVTVEGNVRLANDDLRELTFQMVRELLFNVVKHADVDAAHLKLQRQGARCIIKVEDAGKGFDASILCDRNANAAGYGLSSIRERLQLFDGRFSIDTAPGAGVRVTLSVPARVADESKPD